MCQHYLRVVWGAPSLPLVPGVGSFPRVVILGGSTQGWMASNQHRGVRTSSGGEGQGCSAHSGGGITLSHILLDVQ